MKYNIPIVFTVLATVWNISNGLIRNSSNTQSLSVGNGQNEGVCELQEMAQEMMDSLLQEKDLFTSIMDTLQTRLTDDSLCKDDDETRVCKKQGEGENRSPLVCTNEEYEKSISIFTHRKLCHAHIAFGNALLKTFIDKRESKNTFNSMLNNYNVVSECVDAELKEIYQSSILLFTELRSAVVELTEKLWSEKIINVLKKRETLIAAIFCDLRKGNKSELVSEGVAFENFGLLKINDKDILEEAYTALSEYYYYFPYFTSRLLEKNGMIDRLIQVHEKLTIYRAKHLVDKLNERSKNSVIMNKEAYDALSNYKHHVSDKKKNNKSFVETAQVILPENYFTSELNKQPKSSFTEENTTDIEKETTESNDNSENKNNNNTNVEMIKSDKKEENVEDNNNTSDNDDNKNVSNRNENNNSTDENNKDMNKVNKNENSTNDTVSTSENENSSNTETKKVMDKEENNNNNKEKKESSSSSSKIDAKKNNSNSQNEKKTEKENPLYSIESLQEQDIHALIKKLIKDINIVKFEKEEPTNNIDAEGIKKLINNNFLDLNNNIMLVRLFIKPQAVILSIIQSFILMTPSPERDAKMYCKKTLINGALHDGINEKDTDEEEDLVSSFASKYNNVYEKIKLEELKAIEEVNSVRTNTNSKISALQIKNTSNNRNNKTNVKSEDEKNDKSTNHSMLAVVGDDKGADVDKLIKENADISLLNTVDKTYNNPDAKSGSMHISLSGLFIMFFVLFNYY